MTTLVVSFLHGKLTQETQQKATTTQQIQKIKIKIDIKKVSSTRDIV